MTRVQNRQWKANLLNYEWIEQQTGSACYCLSAKSAQMLLTISNTLAWATRWQGNELFTDEQREQIFKWANDCEAELMNGCCGDNVGIPPIFDFDENGEVIVSIDGGLTWEPSPQSDPRNSASLFPPLPVSGDSGKCAGAENVAAQLEVVVTDMVEKLATETAIGGVLAALLALLAFFITVASVGTAIGATAVLVGFAATLFGVGSAALDDAFDSSTYEAFKCLVYCVIGENQRFTAAALNDLKEAVEAEFAGQPTVIKVIKEFITSMGSQGMTNIARFGIGEGTSCSGCVCDWCYEFDFALGGLEWYTVEAWPGGGSAGAVYAGGEWSSTHPGGLAGDRAVILVALDFASAYVTSIEWFFAQSEMDTWSGDISGGAGMPSPYTQSIEAVKTSIAMQVDGPNSASFTLSKVIVRGTGTSPFGESNC